MQTSNSMSLLTTWIANYSLQQKNILIYAVGGGKGHLQRALNIADALGRATIIHQHDAQHPTHTIISLQGHDIKTWIQNIWESMASKYDCLIVDTFPSGIARELTEEMICAFPLRFLLGRYIQEEAYPQYEEQLSRYTQILLPYTPAYCEWEQNKNGTYIGHLTRKIQIDKNPPVELVVIGDTTKIPTGWIDLFPASAVYIHHDFSMLPHAQRYLCIGAGYNLFWELFFLPIVVQHIPLSKRYDDQFRRAGLWQRIVYAKDHLISFLGTDASPSRDKAIEQLQKNTGTDIS